MLEDKCVNAVIVDIDICVKGYVFLCILIAYGIATILLYFSKDGKISIGIKQIS